MARLSFILLCLVIQICRSVTAPSESREQASVDEHNRESAERRKSESELVSETRPWDLLQIQSGDRIQRTVDRTRSVRRRAQDALESAMDSAKCVDQIVIPRQESRNGKGKGKAGKGKAGKGKAGKGNERRYLEGERQRALKDYDSHGIGKVFGQDIVDGLKAASENESNTSIIIGTGKGKGNGKGKGKGKRNGKGKGKGKKSKSGKNSYSMSMSITTILCDSAAPSLSLMPSDTPSLSSIPSIQPTVSSDPSSVPSVSTIPSITPTLSQDPSSTPSVSLDPSSQPSVSVYPSLEPSISLDPSSTPSVSLNPSTQPTVSMLPSAEPTPTDCVFPVEVSKVGTTLFVTIEYPVSLPDVLIGEDLVLGGQLILTNQALFLFTDLMMLMPGGSITLEYENEDLMWLSLAVFIEGTETPRYCVTEIS